MTTTKITTTEKLLRLAGVVVKDKSDDAEWEKYGCLLYLDYNLRLKAASRPRRNQTPLQFLQLRSLFMFICTPKPPAGQMILIFCLLFYIFGA